MRSTLAVAVGGLVLLAAQPAQAARQHASGKPVVSHLKTNGLVDPLGIAGDDPRLGWQLESPDRGVAQAAYQVRVTAPRQGTVWDSGKVKSDRSIDVRYGGPDLRSHTPYSWSVRVWTGDEASAWSAPAAFETGLLSADEWTADWIGAQGIGAEWTDYTVEFTASDIEAALGVYLPRARHRERVHVADQRGRPRAAPAREAGQRLHGPARDRVPPGLRLRRAASLRDHRRRRRHHHARRRRGARHADERDARRAGRDRLPYERRRDAASYTTSRSPSEGGKVLVDTDFPPGDRSFGGRHGHRGRPARRLGRPRGVARAARRRAGLRRDFQIADKPIARARVYASAQGLYELRLNGERGRRPGARSRLDRLPQADPVPDVRRHRPASRRATTRSAPSSADGWFAGSVAMFGDRDLRRRHRADRAAADRVRRRHGRRRRRPTTAGAPRPARSPQADLLDGETYDARARPAGLGRSAGYDDAGWDPVAVAAVRHRPARSRRPTSRCGSRRS